MPREILRIQARRDGYRRAGLAHTVKPVDHEAADFTEAQIEALDGDERLHVVWILEDDEPNPPAQVTPAPTHAPREQTSGSAESGSGTEEAKPAGADGNTATGTGGTEDSGGTDTPAQQGTAAAKKPAAKKRAPKKAGASANASAKDSGGSE